MNSGVNLHPVSIYGMEFSEFLKLTLTRTEGLLESQGRSSCALTYDFVVERGCNKLAYDAVVCDSRVHWA